MNHGFEPTTFHLSIGSHKPVQHATTELVTLLHEDYGLDYPAASTLLGQCVRYDVGNVFDPAYTIIAKVEKSLLERL
jgi:amidase